MKKLTLLLICICISQAYAQKQIAIIGNVEYSKNKFQSHPQAAFGAVYRQKQNTYGLSIGNIGTDLNTIFKTGFYHIVEAKGFYYRHLNKHKLSGAYVGALISYTQFTTRNGIKFRYNEEPPKTPGDWCGTGIPSPVQYQQLKAIPVLGYEYYPCKRFSIFTEAGYGLLYLKTKTTTAMFDKEITTDTEDIYGNFNFKIGIKSVLYYRAKAL
ncbi:MAG: hypothetical protein V4511_15745 [Bacteroidota bacterium]